MTAQIWFNVAAYLGIGLALLFAVKALTAQNDFKRFEKMNMWPLLIGWPLFVVAIVVLKPFYRGRK